MWFPRRRRDEPDAAPELQAGTAAEPVRGPATPASGPAPAPAPADGPARRDWAAVATIQPISTSISRAVDTHFERDLSSWRSPAVLRPLDHALSSDAPSGLVLDSIARSALPRSEAPADAPEPRTVTFDPPPPAASVFRSADPVTVAPTVTETVAVGAEAPPGPAVESTTPVAAAAAPDVAPGPTVSRAVDPALPELTTEPAPTTTEPAAPAAPTLGGPAASATSATTGPGPAVLGPTTARADTPSADTATSRPRPFGLGAPLSSSSPAVVTGAPSLPVQRATEHAPAPEPAAAGPAAVEGAPAAAAVTGSTEGSPAADAVAGPGGSATEPDAVAEERPEATADVAGGGSSATADDGTDVATAPLVGRQPALVEPQPGLGGDPPAAPGPGPSRAPATGPLDLPARRFGLGEPRSVVQRHAVAPGEESAADTIAAAPNPPPTAVTEEPAGDRTRAEPTPTAAVIEVPADDDARDDEARDDEAAPATAPLLGDAAAIVEPATEPGSVSAVDAPDRSPVGPPSVSWPSSGEGSPGLGSAFAVQRTVFGDLGSPGPAGSAFPAIGPPSTASPSTGSPSTGPASIASPSPRASSPAIPSPGTSGAPTATAPLAGATPPVTVSRAALTEERAAPAAGSTGSPDGVDLVTSFAPAEPAPTAGVGLIGERALTPAVTHAVADVDPSRPSPSASRAVQRFAGPPSATPLASMPSLAPALRWTPARGSTAGPTTTFPTAGRDTPGHEPVSWVDAGAVAIAAGVAQRHADGSVVFASPALDPSEPPPDLSDGPAVQRATDTTPATDNATPPPPAPPAPGSTAPGTTAGHAGANSAELDELAKRLYGRLRVMLKHELRLDRERAGVLTQGRR